MRNPVKVACVVVPVLMMSAADYVHLTFITNVRTISTLIGRELFEIIALSVLILFLRFDEKQYLNFVAGKVETHFEITLSVQLIH